MTDIIKTVRQFTEAIGCTTDHYNVRQTALYTGLQLEEMAEKLEAFGFETQSSHSIVNELHSLSNRFKAGDFDRTVAIGDRAAMLDADVDLAWVTIGSMLSQGADVEGASGEVARANMSKLVKCPDAPDYQDWLDNGNGHLNCKTCNGVQYVAIKDDNGKVKKPENFVPPNIEPFVCKARA